VYYGLGTDVTLAGSRRTLLH